MSPVLHSKPAPQSRTLCTPGAGSSQLGVPLAWSAHITFLHIRWAVVALGWILPLQAAAQHPSPPCTKPWGNRVHLLLHTPEVHAFTPASKQGKGAQDQAPKDCGYLQQHLFVLRDLTLSLVFCASTRKVSKTSGKFGWGAHVPAPGYIYLTLSLCQGSFLATLNC